MHLGMLPTNDFFSLLVSQHDGENIIDLKFSIFSLLLSAEDIFSQNTLDTGTP